MEKKVTMLPARSNRIVKSVGIYCRFSTNKSDQLNREDYMDMTNQRQESLL